VKRILLLVSVAALMSVMLALSGVQAAFAANIDSLCPGPSWFITDAFIAPSYDQNGDAFICENAHNGHFKDDHI
jgi:hypothetical protein